MREIVLDTETTGLDPAAGHRVVEIGCVELVNLLATGRTWHQYLNPQRDMPDEAFKVHGLSSDFLKDHPTFDRVAGDFLDFVGDARLIIHNAQFDLGFLNAELDRLGRPPLSSDRALDTVRLARRRFPGAQANLDALCRRFGIDNTDRTLHGALLDAELLAEVYLELTGGRQPGLGLATAAGAAPGVSAGRPQVARPPRPHAPGAEELAAHRAFLGRLVAPLWET